MRTHTPGTWINGYGAGITGATVRESLEYSEHMRNDPDGAWPKRTSRVVSCKGRTIAIVPDVDGDSEPNARLIAQAPALLETQRHYLLDDAAYAIQAYMDDYGETDDCRYIAEELKKVAEQMREVLRLVNG